MYNSIATLSISNLLDRKPVFHIVETSYEIWWKILFRTEAGQSGYGGGAVVENLQYKWASPSLFICGAPKSKVLATPLVGKHSPLTLLFRPGLYWVFRLVIFLGNLGFKSPHGNCYIWSSVPGVRVSHPHDMLSRGSVGWRTPGHWRTTRG